MKVAWGIVFCIVTMCLWSPPSSATTGSADWARTAIAMTVPFSATIPRLKMERSRGGRELVDPNAQPARSAEARGSAAYRLGRRVGRMRHWLHKSVPITASPLAKRVCRTTVAGVKNGITVGTAAAGGSIDVLTAVDSGVTAVDVGKQLRRGLPTNRNTVLALLGSQAPMVATSTAEVMARVDQFAMLGSPKVAASLAVATLVGQSMWRRFQSRRAQQPNEGLLQFLSKEPAPPMSTVKTRGG